MKFPHPKFAQFCRQLPPARQMLAAAAFLSATTAGLAQNLPAGQDDLQSLREQVRQLDLKIQALERQQQQLRSGPAAPAVTAAPAPATAPIITASTEKGFAIASADGANSLGLHLLVQEDSRWFFSQSAGLTNNDSFLIRRARIFVDGRINNNITFLLIPDFALGAPALFDAYANLELAPEFQLRFGRSRSPVGLEQLQLDAYTFFDERSFVSQIVPNRDIGVTLWGNLFDSTLTYAVGVYDGVPDGQNNGAIAGTTVNSDADNSKDVAARLFYSPFKNVPDSVLKGLGFGLAGTVGRERPASGLAGYKSDAAQTIFSYRAATIIDGETVRIAPQANFYHGPLGLLAEYASSTIAARPTATGIRERLTNRAWNFTVGYVLTGEDSSYVGVTPKTSFNWSKGTWGAFELVARYDVLRIDPKAFAPDPSAALSLADPAASTRGETNVGIGLNWYLNRAVRFNIDFFHGHFDNLLPAGALTNKVIQHDENALLTRFQVVF